MRKIKSEQETQSRKKKMQVFVGMFMVSLMILATAGYFATELFTEKGSIQTNEKVIYGGKTYFRQNDLWILQEQDKQFYFYNLPNESKGVYQNNSTFEDYSGKVLYIVNLVSEAEFIVMNLNGVYTRWQTACIESESCNEDLPIKNCSENLIVFKKGDKDRVERQGNCIFIYGNPEKGIDALSYNLLGIN